MNVVKSSAVAGAALIFVGALSACSGGTGSGASPSDEGSRTASSTADSGQTISSPKDLDPSEPCRLLSAEAATSLGLGPQGEMTSSLMEPDGPKDCVWDTNDGGRVSFRVLDRSLDEYYSNSGQFVDFKRLNIAGHPAVRANEEDRMGDGTCALFLASKDGQLVGTVSQLGHKDVGKVDPCDLAQKTLESAVPTWPSAK